MCSDLYLWIKNVRIREVVKAVGFQSRDLRWYSRVQSGFCLTCYYFMLTSLGFKVSFLTMSLMQDGLCCCLSLDLFDLEFLGFLFSSIVICVANKGGTKTSICKKFVLASKSSCNIDTCEHVYVKLVYPWAFLISWLETCWSSTLDWRQK